MIPPPPQRDQPSLEGGIRRATDNWLGGRLRPSPPKAEQLPAIAEHFSKFNDGALVVSQLTALGSPRTGREKWQALLALARRSARNVNAQLEAATKDVAAFVRLVDEGDQIVSEFGKAGPAAGFGASSPCARYYG